MIGGLFSRRRPSSHAATIRAWVAAHFTLGPDDVVSIAALACGDDGCPDTETVVTVLRASGGSAKWRIEKPLEVVTQRDVEALEEADA